MDPETYQEIADMLNANMSVEFIAHETGYSSNTIYKVRRDLGIRGRRDSVLEGVDLDELCEMYDRGDRLIDIADHFGMASASVYTALTLAGHPIRKYDPVVNEARERQILEAIGMYEAGYLIKEIVRDTGLPQTVLHQELFKRGVPLRAPKSAQKRRDNTTG